ncbi:hypothetical protein IQ244_30175 [Nostoc sp. LEGE 06077]|uniref:hypothetical protein n=1 Tax=Nostoc sp. LEGE 06077 TaxID=915325 RepID=UPI00188256AB|nr:hypothetical protein [Nostoc sp. LEGE 06077]MBE9210695.1 hypothetical protein [Nostoc sp. LEGE 06077]
MSDSVQYVTNQDGERVGVLLDLATYQQLTNSSLADNEPFAVNSRVENVGEARGTSTQDFLIY